MVRLPTWAWGDRRERRIVGLVSAFVVLTTVVLPLCGQTETLVMMVGDAERTALVHVPSNVQPESEDGQRLPLVLAFHGSAQNAGIMEEMTGLSDLSEEEGFLVAYPSGSGPAGALSWNTGHCCSFALERGADDIGFVHALLDELIATYPVDPSRIYLTGFSNGGMLAYKLAVEMPERIAGIAVVAGAMYPSQAAPTSPVPVLAIHGTADQIVPYEGGTGLLSGISGKTEPSLPSAETVSLWVQVNGCTEEPTISRERNARIETFAPCDGQADVTFVTLVEGAHRWPTIQRDESASLLPEADDVLGLFGQDGTATEIPWDIFETGIDATATIWAFFARHR